MKRAWTLSLALAAFTAVAVLWIVTDRRASQRVYDTYSSVSTAKTGLSLASGYLAKRTKVGTLNRPLGREPVERNAVVFRVAKDIPVFFDPEDLDPKQFGPPKPKRQALLNERDEAFVRRGGRMVLASCCGVLDTTTLDAGETVRKVLPIWPAVGDVTLEQEATAFLSLPPRMVPILVAGKHPVLGRERIGEGELYVLSLPDLLRNDELAKNLALLSALAGERRPVYFDEVLHGIVHDDGALALMQEWNLGAFLMMLGVAALLLFWREGRRIGPAEEDVRETRSDAVDLVRSLGALYHEVTTDTQAIELYYDALTRSVAHSSGLRGDALRKRVEELTGGIAPPTGSGTMPRVTFARHLAAINEGFAKSEAHRRTGSEAHRRKQSTSLSL